MKKLLCLWLIIIGTIQFCKADPPVIEYSRYISIDRIENNNVLAQDIKRFFSIYIIPQNIAIGSEKKCIRYFQVSDSIYSKIEGQLQSYISSYSKAKKPIDCDNCYQITVVKGSEKLTCYTTSDENTLEFFRNFRDMLQIFGAFVYDTQGFQTLVEASQYIEIGILYKYYIEYKESK